MATRKLGYLGLGLVGASLGLTWWASRRKAPSPPGEAEDEKLAEEAAKVQKTILEQHLVRIAMHKKALPAADMDRAVQIAGNLGLTQTVATLDSIAEDGRPGGPNYVPLPTAELWPGTKKSVRRYIAEAMQKLSQEATA